MIYSKYELNKAKQKIDDLMSVNAKLLKKIDRLHKEMCEIVSDRMETERQMHQWKIHCEKLLVETMTGKII